MSCTVGGTNVKVFGKAIHSLSKIGEDLYIETSSNGLVFRTVNSARSAYACFTFKPQFFTEYANGSDVKCKVSLKSCLMAFKFLNTLEKTVDKFLVDLISIDNMLLIQFFCRHAMMKIYHLPFIENETVQAAFEKNGPHNKLSAQSRLLSDAVQNFSANVEEVTLTICNDKVTIRNYVDDEPDPNQVVHTELTLESEEFEDYEIDEETEVTFCLKELRAVLGFSEGCNVPVSIYCQRGGKPIWFSIDSIPGVESDFVLATLADRGIEASGTSGNTNPITRPAKAKRNLKNAPKQIDRCKGANRDDVVVHVIDTAHISVQSNVCNQTVEVENKRSQEIVSQPERHDVEERSEMSAVSTETSIIHPEEKNPGNVTENCDFEQDDIIPSSPPSKKFRSAFLGLSQATYTTMAPDPDEILAEASDED